MARNAEPDIPDLNGLVQARAREPAPITECGDTPHSVRVAFERGDTCLRVEIPHLDGLVATSACESPVAEATPKFLCVETVKLNCLSVAAAFTKSSLNGGTAVTRLLECLVGPYVCSNEPEEVTRVPTDR